MIVVDWERIAFAFVLAGARAALRPAVQRRLSPAGRMLLAVCTENPVAVRAIGLESALRVWRRGLLPRDRDRLIPTRLHYAAALRLARAADHTTARELAGEPHPGLEAA